jgi:hypothetical protein
MTILGLWDLTGYLMTLSSNPVNFEAISKTNSE